jgi:hypothetical protein
MSSLCFKTATVILSTGLSLVACAPETSLLEATPLQAVSVADYQRAEGFLAVNTSKLLQNNILAQYWQSNGRLIYRRSTLAGSDM